MLTRVKEFIKGTPLARPFIFLKSMVTRPRTQNAEAEIIARLIDRPGVAKRFIEFGFSGWEFNCAPLAYEWAGLLVDGDAYNVTIANIILPRRVAAKQMWITLETLSVIRAYAVGHEIGILSIDVDGNDYWFLERLIDLRPAIIIAEYNSVFGLRRITVPYADDFDRRNYPGWTYFGASLAALTCLANQHGYSLVAQVSGINAFFVRDDLLTPNDTVLTAEQAYEARHAHKWAAIEQMPFITV